MQENFSSPGPRKTKNETFLLQADTYACHNVIGDMSFPLGNFSIPRSWSQSEKMAPHRVRAAPNCNDSSRSGPTSQYSLAHRKWMMNFSKVHVCYSAEGRSVYAVSPGRRRYDDVIKFSRFSLLSSGDNAPRHIPHERYVCTLTHTHTHRAVL